MIGLRQFFKYCGVAATSALIDWIIYVVLVYHGVYFVNAQVASRLFGGAYAFIGNKYWSFSKRDHISMPIEGRRFLLLYVFSYGLSLTLLWLFGSGLELNVFVAKLITDSSCFVFNFVLMQAYVFHDRLGLSAGLRKIIQQFRKTA